MIVMLSVRLAANVHAYLGAYAPSNILIRHLRTPNGRWWALPVSIALTSAYMAATAGLNSAVEAGAPGWLNAATALCAWNAIKFGFFTFAASAALIGRALGRPA
ncbi:hypothetical protein J2S59_003099 [Nocardioides massiliensis]|uniref:Sulfate permease n=2 Tax=Nocardioides massiliensis TaxID=1325935 RepID=A0ABT9NTC1_9ACTN|nr:hypothetical protein [Nocardioides massiliensis]MDP9823290.1 hypothetical protein [Nocardioides massiliensis]